MRTVASTIVVTPHPVDASPPSGGWMCGERTMRTRMDSAAAGTPPRFAESVSGIGADGEHDVEHGALTASTVSPVPSM